MTGAEAGLLLLCCSLGDPGRRPLTPAQLRELGRRVRETDWRNRSRELTAGDLRALGYEPEAAEHILRLLEDRPLLEYYVNKGAREGCVPVTRLDPAFPPALRKRLGEDCPAFLWAKGEVSLLDGRRVALVGSRDLLERNRAFAQAAGEQAARQGMCLVSGNARGSDQTAQRSAMRAGGSVISVVADSLRRKRPEKGMLYLSEDGYDEPFSSQRALRRNRVIHALGEITLVAQCTQGAGGTWNGTMRNLRCGWSPVFCFRDGSPAAAALAGAGARLIGAEALEDIGGLCALAQSLPGE